jgi:epoxide hydrolase-like predicted phosphatase
VAIKTIIFDFGGVLYKTYNLTWLKNWKDHLGMVNDSGMVDVLSDPNESSLIKDICLGRLPEEALWEKMVDEWHIKPLFIKYLQYRMTSKASLNKSMVKFLAELHQNYQTAILSNAGEQSRQLMEDTFRLDRYVEQIIISAEEGLIKPDPRIYQIALTRLDADPHRTLFLDDTLINVFIAREIGMTAVQYINNHQAIQMVRDLISREA